MIVFYPESWPYKIRFSDAERSDKNKSARMLKLVIKKRKQVIKSR